MRFSDGMVIHRVSKVEESQLLMLDSIVANGPLAPYWEGREQRRLGGASLWVISRDHLIAMKTAAGRPQDRADVARLLELDR